MVTTGKEIEGQVGTLRREFHELTGDMPMGFQIERIHLVLGVSPHGVGTVSHLSFGGVEGDDVGEVVGGGVDGPGSQAEDEPQYAGFGIDVRTPRVWVEGQAYTGDVREEPAAVSHSGDSLHQDRHLFVPAEQAMGEAIAERVHAHSTGVYRLHGRDELIHPLLGRALIHAEHTRGLAGVGTVEAVLQQAAGTHDDG